MDTLRRFNLGLVTDSKTDRFNSPNVKVLVSTPPFGVVTGKYWSQEIINSECAKCPLKIEGTCTPAINLFDDTRVTITNGMLKRHARDPIANIPLACPLAGSVFELSAGVPAHLRFLTPAELATLPSANPTDADLQTR